MIMKTYTDFPIFEKSKPSDNKDNLIAFILKAIRIRLSQRQLGSTTPCALPERILMAHSLNQKLQC